MPFSFISPSVRHFSLAAAVVLVAGLAPGVTLDRLAITIGKQAITEQQLDEELRVTAFLNRQLISRDAAARKGAAKRLVELILISSEMENTHFPAPSNADVDAYLAQVRDEYQDAAEYDDALSRYHLTEPILKQHLSLQLITLRFIEYRFRPDVAAAGDSEERTDHVLDTWLAENLKLIHIEYLDNSLQ
jgi:hypothetical protein